MATSTIPCSKNFKYTTISGTTNANGELDIGIDADYLPIVARLTEALSNAAIIDFRQSTGNVNYYVAYLHGRNNVAIANTSVNIMILWAKIQ